MQAQLYHQLLNAAAMVLYRHKKQKQIGSLQRQIESYQYEETELQEKIKNVSAGETRSMFSVFCFILTFLNVGFFITSLFMPGEISSMSIFISAFFAFWVFIFLITGTILAISGSVAKKKARIAAEQEYKRVKTKKLVPGILQCQKSIEAATAEIEEFWTLHKPLIKFLPTKYQTADAVAFMLEAIKNLRADTLTGVINLYEEELHWRKTQSAIAQQTMLQQRQSACLNNMLNEIADNQETLHADLRSIQVLQTMELFNK